MSTSIKIDQETKNILNLLKYKLGLKSLDAVLNYLLNKMEEIEDAK